MWLTTFARESVESQEIIICFSTWRINVMFHVVIFHYWPIPIIRLEDENNSVIPKLRTMCWSTKQLYEYVKRSEKKCENVTGKSLWKRVK